MHSWANDDVLSWVLPLNHIHQDTKSARQIAACKRTFNHPTVEIYRVSGHSNEKNNLCWRHHFSATFSRNPRIQQSSYIIEVSGWARVYAYNACAVCPIKKLVLARFRTRCSSLNSLIVQFRTQLMQHKREELMILKEENAEFSFMSMAEHTLARCSWKTTSR